MAALGLALVLASGPTPAAGPPEPPADSPAELAPEPDRARERESGGLSLGLGLVLAGAGAGLIGYGAKQFVQARAHLEFCRGRNSIDEPLVPGNACRFDPPNFGFASAGLSWGLSLPLLVGAGMLLARGAKLVRGPRPQPDTHARSSLYPWWRHDGGGLAFVLRF